MSGFCHLLFLAEFYDLSADDVVAQKVKDKLVCPTK